MASKWRFGDGAKLHVCVCEDGDSIILTCVICERGKVCASEERCSAMDDKAFVIG